MLRLSNLFYAPIESVKKVIYLGAETKYNLSSALPGVNYTKLTVDDFIVETSGAGRSANTTHIPDHDFGVYIGSSGSYNLTKTYNSETGELVISSTFGISGSAPSMSCSSSGATSIKVYAMLDNIPKLFAAIYGAQELYTNATGSVDIKTKLPTMYSSLIASDFAIYPNNASASNTTRSSPVMNYRSFDGTGDYRHTVTRSYNSETGVLTFTINHYDYAYLDTSGYVTPPSASASVTSSCNIYLMVKHKLATKVGRFVTSGINGGKSVDVTKIPNYEHLTTNNFIIDLVAGNSGTFTWHDGTRPGEGETSRSATATASFSTSKSYNAETGLFSFSISGNRNSSFEYNIYEIDP